MSFESEAVEFEEAIHKLMEKYPKVAYVMVATHVGLEPGQMRPIAVIGNVKHMGVQPLLSLGMATVANVNLDEVAPGKAN